MTGIFRCNMQNFPQQTLQTPISQKQKIFEIFWIFLQYAELQHSNTNISKTKDFFWNIAYLECASNLEHFEKKDEHPSLVISEIIDSERVGYLNV